MVFLSTAIVTTIAFFVSEYILPRVFKGSLEAPQRHFYAALIAAFSLVMSYTIAYSHTLYQKIADVEAVVTSVTDTRMKSHFHDMIKSYHANFRKPSRLLAPWVELVVSDFNYQMDEERVTLPIEHAEDNILSLFQDGGAYRYIVSVHFGSLQRYTELRKFVQADKDAYDRGVPVVRFYIFDGDLQQRTENPVAPMGDHGGNPLKEVYVREDGVTMDEYNSDVKRLHEEMKTLFSVVIPLRRLEIDRKMDIIMVDGYFVARTSYTDGVTYVTEKSEIVREVRRFLSDLIELNVDMAYMHHLADDQIVARYPYHTMANRDGTEGDMLAKTIAYDLIARSD